MLLNLSTTSGLPITYDTDAQSLACSPDLLVDKVVQRQLHAMLPLLQEPEGQDPDRVLYYMTYNIRFPGQDQALRALALRYDITVLLPGTVGREPIKTAGHYHPDEPTSGLSYPEIYTVLAGRANWLLQRDGERPGEVAEAILVEAEAGDKLVVPPGYGHISINAGPGPLVMANLVGAAFTPDYGPIRELGGGCYLPTLDDAAGVTYRKNDRYGKVAALQRVRPAELPELGLTRSVPLYTAFAAHPERFKYVAQPGVEGGGESWAKRPFWN